MAEDFKCTPNTRLRKDRELFGNFAGFTFSTTNNDRVKPVQFKSSTLSLDECPPQKKPKEKDFSLFHKKQGLKSLQDDKGRRLARLKTDKERQKNRRSEVLMDRRKVRDITPTNDLLSALEDSSNDTPNNQANNNNNPKGNRGVQLQKWREQKQAAAVIAAEKRKKPNAVGSKPVSARGVNTVLVRPVVPRLGAVPARQAAGQSVPQATKIPTMPARKLPASAPAVTRGAGDGKAGERRVTRAMVKAQTTGPAAVSMQPAIAKMKNLTLHSKPKVPAEHITKPKPVAIVDKKTQKVPTATNGRSVRKAPSKEKIPDAGDTEMKEKVVLKNSSKTGQVLQEPVSKNDALSTEAPPAPAKPKKKIMGIDSVYVEFNQKLAEASTLLMRNWNYWDERKRNDATIPEDLLGDVESTQGQAKLLMDSKLPQFAQLLYFYLSKEENSEPVLPCDLHGWWDVAAIQVEKVAARFDGLSKLEKNGWRPPTPPLNKLRTTDSMHKSNQEASDTNSKAESQVKPKPNKVKAQASSGLRAFLASQRKNLMPKNEDESSEKEGKLESEAQPKASTPPQSKVTPTKDASPLRQFEGGFFQIASPLRSSNKNHSSILHSPRVNALRSSTKAPVNRRSSIGSNISLVMLRVRNSMGPMCKLGAASEQINPETPKSVVEYTQSTPAALPNDSMSRPMASDCTVREHGEKYGDGRKQSSCVDSDVQVVDPSSDDMSHHITPIRRSMRTGPAQQIMPAGTLLTEETEP